MKKDFYHGTIVKIQLALLLVGLIFLYWPSFEYWAHTWLTNINYQTGFMMPFLAAYVVRKRWYLFSFTPIKPSRSGQVVVIFGLLLYVAGLASHTATAQQLSFFIILPGIIFWYFGFHVLRTLAIPFLILVFMMPYAEYFYTDIQSTVAVFSTTILRFLQIPVYMDGHCIQLPSVTVNIATECSGLRLMGTLFPISLAIGWIFFAPRWKKISLAFFSAILAVLANIFRIVSMLVIAQTGNDVLIYGTPHKIYGYVVFLAALLIQFRFVGFLKHFKNGPFPNGKNLIREQKLSMPSWAEGFVSYGNLVFILLIVLILTLVHVRLATQPAIPLLKSFKAFPAFLGPWRQCAFEPEVWHPETVGAQHNLRRCYKDAKGNEVKVFVSYFPIQTQGNELVYHRNSIIPPGYKVTRRDVKTWSINMNPRKMRLKSSVLQLTNGIHSETLLYWFKNTNHHLHSKIMAKAIMALDILLKNRSNGSVFVLRFRSSDSRAGDSKIKLGGFLEEFMREITQYIPS
jgi:EpsI family protein